MLQMRSMHVCYVASTVSSSLRPRGLQPTRFLCPWDSPGKNTGVGCRALLQGIFPTEGLNPRLLRFLNRQEGSTPRAPPREGHSQYSTEQSLQVASEAGSDATLFITSLPFSSLILKTGTVETWFLDRSEINMHKTVGHNT